MWLEGGIEAFVVVWVLADVGAAVRVAAKIDSRRVISVITELIPAIPSAGRGAGAVEEL